MHEEKKELWPKFFFFYNTNEVSSKNWKWIENELKIFNVFTKSFLVILALISPM